MTALLFLVTYQDWKERKISNRYIISIFLIGVLRGIVREDLGWAGQFFGFFAVSVPMIVLNYMFSNSFGSGDIKMMGAAGVFLGVSKIWSAFCSSVFFAGFYLILCQIVKGDEGKRSIAFGPFLSLGIFMCIWLHRV